MMTWRLWRLFFGTLPRHPLFWYPMYAVSAPKPAPSRNIFRRIGRLLLVLIMPLVVWILFLPMFVMLPLLLVLAATYGGALAAFSVSRLTIREYETGRYDQIAVTPDGDFGLSWALAQRVLRRHPSMRQFLRSMRAIHAILFGTMLGISVINLLFLGSDQAFILESGLPVLLIVITFILFLRLDLMQALLIGTMVGMLSPTWTRRSDSSLLAVSLVMLLQFGMYLVVALIVAGMTMLFSLDADLLWNTEGFLIILMTVLGAVFVLHELIMAGMWRILSDRLNFNPQLLTTKEHDVT